MVRVLRNRSATTVDRWLQDGGPGFDAPQARVLPLGLPDLPFHARLDALGRRLLQGGDHRDPLDAVARAADRRGDRVHVGVAMAGDVDPPAGRLFGRLAHGAIIDDRPRRGRQPASWSYWQKAPGVWVNQWQETCQDESLLSHFRTLPANVYKVEADGQMIALYWGEKGEASVLQDISAVLKALA